MSESISFKSVVHCVTMSTLLPKIYIYILKMTFLLRMSHKDKKRQTIN